MNGGNATRLGAVVLAAGLSSRMKEFKPLLKIGGETMVFRVVSMMANAGACPIAVVTGYRRKALEDGLRQEKQEKYGGVFFVHNKHYGETQMLESLLIGLDAVKDCEKILVSPADVPLVLPETVMSILRLNAPFVRPVYRGNPGHPVLLSAEIIPVISSYKGGGGLRGAAESAGIDIAEMETDDQGVVLDADSKEDYAFLTEFYNERKLRKESR